MKMMLERDSDSGKRRVGGWENKGNLDGEPTNILKRKHRLKSLRKESKDFARVGWILDYGLRFREKEGRAGGKNKDNLEGETTNILKRKHRLKSLRKESKDFARVGWILDYRL